MVICGGIIKKDEKYLLVQESHAGRKGLWNVPSGHSDPNELLTETAVRETKEETGLDVELTGICQIGSHRLPDESFALIMFTTRIIGGELISSNEEILQTKWFSYDEIIALGDQLRSKERILHAIGNVEHGLVAPLDLLKVYEPAQK